MIITNGVFNLCVDKPKFIAEMFRVLWPGSCLPMADIFLAEHVTSEQFAGMSA
jgi:hypothetical protein